VGQASAARGIIINAGYEKYDKHFQVRIFGAIISYPNFLRGQRIQKITQRNLEFAAILLPTGSARDKTAKWYVCSQLKHGSWVLSLSK